MSTFEYVVSVLALVLGVTAVGIVVWEGFKVALKTLADLLC